MTPQTLIQKALDADVRIRINGGNLRLRGPDHAIQKLTPLLREHKAAVIAFLKDSSISAQAREFMEVDGMTLEEAQAWEAQSVEARPTDAWIALIQNLDAIIDRYCTIKQVSPKARADMLTARMNQSLSSIPETLAWFHNQLNEGKV